MTVHPAMSALVWPTPRELLEPVGTLHPAWARHVFPAKNLRPICRRQSVLGLFATRIERWRWGLPIAVVASAPTDLAFEGTPLVRRDSSSETIARFIALQGGRPILFSSIPVEGAFFAALKSAARELRAPVSIVREWRRAALVPQGGYDHWLQCSIDGKRRNKYRRLRSRLASLGKLESRSFGLGGPLDTWIEQFLLLEAKGWKGRRGTAVACRPAGARALTRAMHDLVQEGALRFWALSLDARPVAMMFAIVSGPKGWIGKIAYDETFAKFSPGVLLTLDATKGLFSEPHLALVDSCATPGHPMIDRIWRDRIVMADVLVGAPGASQTAFEAMVWAERSRGSLRECVKSSYRRLTARYGRSAP